MRLGELFCGDKTIATRAMRADSLLDRVRGLLGRASLSDDEALLITRCRAVHTVGMRFNLDLIFLDREWRATRVVRGVRPGRLMVWGGWCARHVVELATAHHQSSSIQIGAQMEWRLTRGSPLLSYVPRCQPQHNNQ